MQGDPVAKAIEHLHQLENLEFTGRISVTFELYQGGIRACNFTTEQKLHPEPTKKETKNKNK